MGNSADPHESEVGVFCVVGGSVLVIVGVGVRVRVG